MIRRHSIFTSHLLLDDSFPSEPSGLSVPFLFGFVASKAAVDAASDCLSCFECTLGSGQTSPGAGAVSAAMIVVCCARSFRPRLDPLLLRQLLQHAISARLHTLGSSNKKAYSFTQSTHLTENKDGAYKGVGGGGGVTEPQRHAAARKLLNVALHKRPRGLAVHL